MPVDYSKWDALELSDDSDIEVHPNVDKKSFIRAKQTQIHNQRAEQKHQVVAYTYERIINDGLLERINGLLTALESHKAEADKRNPDELLFQAIMESVSNAENDQPPPRPDELRSESKEEPSYSKMMAALVDQVKAKVEEDKSGDRFAAYIAELNVHREKIKDLQKSLTFELDKLESLPKKITSDGLRTGFDSSHVTKAEKVAQPVSKDKTRRTEKVQAVEVLNPKALGARGSLAQEDMAQTSGADADIDEPLVDLDEGDDEEEADVEASDLGKRFGDIKMGNYSECLQFISKNHQVLAEKETDGLLVMAFNAALDGKDDAARRYVHQALLLQYCRTLDRDRVGPDGVNLFFKRITTPGHKGRSVFIDDVESTYQRIRSRTKEIAKQRATEAADGAGGVEQIQLHAVDPGTSINITIPSKESEIPEELEARKLFDAFPPGLQRALESASLDEVNKVLGKMSVEEAEEVVGHLSTGGIISVEEQIIDATTEEGQAAVKELDKQAQADARTRDLPEDPE